MALLLYHFRYRDRRTGRWITAPYRAELPVIFDQYSHTEYELIGEPEVREGAPRSFNPYRHDNDRATD